MPPSPFVKTLRRKFGAKAVAVERSAQDRGDLAREAHDWKRAADAYREHLADHADDAAIWVQLGHMLKEDGQLADARTAYARAVETDPASADAQLYYGHLLVMQGELGEAAQAFRASFEIDGNADAARELAAPEIRALFEPPPTPAEPTPEPEAAPAPPPRRHVGVIDTVNGVEVNGWAVNPDDPAAPAEIEFYTSEGMIGGAVSTLFRSDVAQTGVGTTTAGFSATLDLDRRDRRVYTVHAFLRGTGEELEHSPFEATGFSPLRGHDEGDPVTSARFAVAKRFEGTRDEVALFVTHSPDGVLKPHVPAYLEALRDSGVDILLIVVADRPIRLSRAQLDLVAGAIVRQNVGYDFAAWAHAMHLHPEVYGSAILYLINDSMFGPSSPAAFARMMERLRASDADLVGLTENHESGWHVQSYFMALKQPLLASSAVQRFFATMVNLPGKQEVIDTYEIKLAPLVEAHGFRAEALFASRDPRNATMFDWRGLIESGFPFVKTLLFRQKSFLFDVDNWERDLAGYGFDVPLLKDVLKHHGVTGYVPPDFPLLAMPEDRSRAAGAPLKVAFYGPWNYDNGLGAASRGIIAALRTTGVRLNLHPVRKTFHIHRPLVPDHEIIDFEGPADVAIVHLNPDSWHILTDEQRRGVDRAGKRIGYWVWEMSHLPEGWRADFASVDRIWTPSSYCAELFDAQNEAAVEVIPHAVPLPERGEDKSGRAAVLAALGLPAGRRIILYAFDGSSYLARKNPHALIRAFVASGLGKRGWTLVLKTKHLMDRPAEGAAFQRLAERTRDIVLIDRALPPSEMEGLFAAADIYASPHCSEGFGLTIAEAMAAGKPVVATDYSGSTDFLDASCGFPVAAERHRLSESFGHYTSGGEWARIDEKALADTLSRVAAGNDAGDRTIGAAARARIAERLSYEAVGARIRASLADLFEEAPPRWRRPRPLGSRMEAGQPLDQADLGDTLAIAPLMPDSLVPAGKDELERVAARPDRWLIFAPEGAKLSPHLRSLLMVYAGSRPDAAIFYGDDFATGEMELAGQLRLKPEFDITLLSAQDYIGAPLIVRGSALHRLGGLRHGLGAAALTDLVLRAWGEGMAIVRLPHVLLGHPGKRPTVPAAERRAVLLAQAAYKGHDLLPGLAPGTLQLTRRFDAAAMPPVTLLVPTRRSTMADGTPYVARLLDSLAATDWPMDRLTVLIGDDVTGEPEWAQDRPFAVRRIEMPRGADEPFNYAAKMNRLWRAAESEHVVMLNDDVVAQDGAWLKALMTFAMRADVGAAGPLLLYENGTVQHAGIVGGLLGIVAHAWLYRRSTANTYQDWAIVHREWSMITGAVMATRRSMLERVSGFDERFALEYNDLDLCLRLRATGARIVYTPHARMTHAEKASRGDAAPPPIDLALFLRRWKGWLADDPAFHPRMDHGRFDLEPGYEADDWFVR